MNLSLKLNIFITLALIFFKSYEFQAVELTRILLQQWLGSSMFRNVINLSFKNIGSIQYETFNGLQTLQALYLNNNKLTALDPDTFNGCYNLQSLDLDFNQIASLEANTFKDLRSLEFLYMSGNQIISIDRNIFVGLLNLKEVNLSMNPISTTQASYVKSLCQTNPRCVISV